MNDSFIKKKTSCELQPHLHLQYTRSSRRARKASELMISAMPHLTQTVQNQLCASKLLQQKLWHSLDLKYRL